MWECTRTGLPVEADCGESLSNGHRQRETSPNLLTSGGVLGKATWERVRAAGYANCKSELIPTLRLLPILDQSEERLSVPRG